MCGGLDLAAVAAPRPAPEHRSRVLFATSLIRSGDSMRPERLVDGPNPQPLSSSPSNLVEGASAGPSAYRGAMRILVAGDRGHRGGVIVPLFHRAGHERKGLDAGWYDGCDFGPPLGGYEQRTADIRDVHPDELAGLHAVVNLAAISNDTVGDLNPRIRHSVNAGGAIQLARRAKAAGVPRYVFPSSCSLYGAAAEEPCNEEAPFKPVTPYGESKIMAEAGLSELADKKFSPTYLRNVTASGSSPRQRADIVVNNLTGLACIDNADDVRFAVASAAVDLACPEKRVLVSDLTNEDGLDAALTKTTPRSSANWPIVSRPRGVPALAGRADSPDSPAHTKPTASSGGSPPSPLLRSTSQVPEAARSSSPQKSRLQ